MPLLAIPNVSEGRDPQRIGELADAIERSGGRVLDLHSDRVHNRSVITTTGTAAELVAAMTALAVAASHIDLTAHEGVHPRLGGLDVCPFVPVETPMAEAVRTAHDAGRAINEATGIPIYFYAEATERHDARRLSSIRKGGLEALQLRAQEGFPPDIVSAVIDPRRGVVCVGARRPLIAFNVWLRCDPAIARWIAGRLRASAGGLPGVQALGLLIQPPDVCQVSMNLTHPEATGIERAFDATRSLAALRGAAVLHTEIVGLVQERYLPGPGATATRLLIEPGRSLEAALEG
jgi:glutamate formiminotransferase